MSMGSSQRILVVDDEEDVRILVSRILGDMGFEVDSAVDGGEAIDKVAAAPPDLVVLDLMMPGIDGWGVLRHLRQLPDPPPVVVMTARGDYGTFSRVVQEGAAAYVTKPFRFHELVATCQRVLLESATRISPDSERRRDSRRRLMVRVEVLSREKQPVAIGELVNLSPGGAQVQLGVPLEPGARVQVAVHLPGGGGSLGLEGEVQWRQDREQGFSHGLAFVGLRPEQDRQIQDLLKPPS